MPFTKRNIYDSEISGLHRVERASLSGAERFGAAKIDQGFRGNVTEIFQLCESLGGGDRANLAPQHRFKAVKSRLRQRRYLSESH